MTELAVRAAAAGVIAAILSVIIKRTNPELSSAVSLFAAASIMLSALSSSAGVTELFEIAQRSLNDSAAYLIPLLKCTAIGIITKLSSELCRETAHNGIASSVELAGTLCAMGVTAPLILDVLEMIGEMV